jgi:hypothetical protein
VVSLDAFHHFLHRAGVDVDEPLAIIGDGGEDVAYPTYLPWRPVTRILDWFHIAMRFEHLLQRARGLRKEEPERSERLVEQLESAKWRLWHAQGNRSIDRLRDLQEGTADLFRQRVSEMIRYLELNRDRLIGYNRRYGNGLAISTSLAESAVNSVIGERFKKQHQMRWTAQGANRLLHLRVADLNGVLRDYVGAYAKRRSPANDSRVAAAA